MLRPNAGGAGGPAEDTPARYATRELVLSRASFQLFSPLLPPLSLAVAGLLLAVTPAAAGYGGFLVAWTFTSGDRDSYTCLVLGMPVLALGAVAAAAAWQLVAPRFTIRSRAVGWAFAVLVFGLPAAAGVWTAEEAPRWWRTYPGEQRLAPLSALPYALRYPPTWSLFPPSRPDQPAGTVTLTSWSATTPVAAVPRGGLKVTIGPAVGPVTGKSVAVGAGRYPGTRAETPAANGGDAHTIAIVYAVDGRLWRIEGAFAEPPGRGNPNTVVFDGIIVTVKHRE